MLRTKRSALLPLLASLLCLLIFSGCSRIPLFSELSENEANEMMAILLERHISCTKTAAKEEKWILKVSADDFSKAVEILKAQGYPHERFVRIGDVFQKSGLVSSPTEERIRYMYALSQELAATLMRIDGVLNARVHIVIPDNDPLAEKVTPSSAAVFIRYRPGFDLESLTPQLKNLVTRSIEGLKYDNVSLVLIPAASVPSSAASLAKKETETASAGLLLPALIVGASIVAGAGLWVFNRRKGPKAAATDEAA